MHAEFLIDRSGYIRARWLPVEDNIWSDPVSSKPSSKCCRASRPHRRRRMFTHSIELRSPHESRTSLWDARGHNIAGSTLSGGRWPSMKVLMLMMTFSPMSMRPSAVAEPMCGNKRDLAGVGQSDKLLRDRRLMLENVEPRAGQFVRLEHAGERGLVDDFTACRIDEDRVRAQIF